MINDEGGVNGRRIKFIVRDDAYSPPKTVEEIRQLVEQDRVLATFNTLGTPTNSAIRRNAAREPVSAQCQSSIRMTSDPRAVRTPNIVASASSRAAWRCPP